VSAASHPARPFAGPPARPRPAESRLPVAVARMPAFLALAGFGAHTWVQMVAPAAPGAMLAALVAALAGGLVLIVVSASAPGRPVRIAATALVAIGLLLVALAAAGVPAGLARPRSWDDLAGGIAQGLSAVPNVRVPYQGADEWTRLVIVLGCGALVGLATLLAFAPRRDGALGHPVAAAIVLATLCLVPAMQREGRHPFLGGAVLALLLALFLWLERVERRSAPVAAGVVVAAVLAALAVAPAIDGARPLLDYEQLAQSLTDAPVSHYEWNHEYGRLDWPRNASEVLRVRAHDRAYWKAADLSSFDGFGWLQAEPHATDKVLDATAAAGHRDWIQTLRVTLRALSSDQFVAAGTVIDIQDSPRIPVQAGPGSYATRDRPLKRGNSYKAIVYTPRPSARELREAAVLPLPPAGPLTSIQLPGPPGITGFPTRGERVTLAPWGRGQTPPATVASIEDSPYAGAYALARRLRAQSASPYEFVLAVEQHLADGYRYSEDPPPSRMPLEDFLFRDKVGYCQQFSGAMALLLRLGGVPARVAAGFAPGVYDSERKEFVVRDLDAHSWVEVFFPGIGWVTRDPTPSDSPARAQVADIGAAAADSRSPIPDVGGATRRGDSPSGGAGAPAGGAGAGGRSPAIVVGVALALVLAAAALALAVRRRRRAVPADDAGAAQLAELRRALRRSGRPPAPHTTLETLAARFDATPAERYVRALAAARYGYGAGPPTAGDRAALRRELASGLGLRGRLRAWWALPPRAPGSPARRGS
jgi:transglutaminase-like putative cysteine protease